MTEGTDAITTIHIAIIVILAAVTIVAIGWGVRLKRRRVKGQQEFETHAEEAGVPVGAADSAEPEPAAPTPVAAAPEPAPVAPVAPAPSLPTEAPAADAPAPVEAAPSPIADEPIAAAPMPEGAPATLAADADADTSAADPANGAITQIKGLGPKVAARLGELGIDRIGQIAALDDAAAADVDARMGPFTGRLVRDRWVEQARLLAAGDRDGFERVFGRL